MPVSGSGEILLPLTRYCGVSQVCDPPENRFDMSNAPPGGRGVWQPSQAMTALTREPPRSTGVSARAALSIAQSAVTMIVTTRWIFGLVRPRKLWIAAAPTLPAMIDNTSVCRAFIITPLPVVARTPRVLARTFEIMLRPRETRNQKRLSWRKYSLWLWRFCRWALVPIGTFGSCPRDGMGHAAAAPPSSVMNSRRFN